MLNLDLIIKEWENDSVIDDSNLVHESLRVPQLHAKYIRMLTSCKKSIQVQHVKLVRLLKLKTVYYNGEMSREELVRLGWKQYQGRKPLKSEMSQFIESDEDFIELDSLMKYLVTIKETVESILKMIHQRSYDIKNAIEMTKFLAGG